MTEGEWEVQDPLAKALQGTAGSRLYPCVEVSLNQPIWHLDLYFEIDQVNDIGHWRRFILASVAQVAATLEDHSGKCCLHLQSARTRRKAAAYEIWPVQSLEIGEDRNGRVVHLVRLPHRNLTYPDRTVLEPDLVGMRRVYDANCLETKSSHS